MGIEGIVGPVQLGDGSVFRGRYSKTGALLVSQTNARYQEAVQRGNVYVAMNQTGCVWSVGLTATYTGCCVSNPNGSGKILSILAAGFYEVVAPAGIQAVALAAGFSTTNVTHSVAGVPINMLIGSSAIGSGKWDTGATMAVAPSYVYPLELGKTSAALSTASGIAVNDVGGLIQLLPGAYIIIATFTATAAVGGMGAIIWEELAL